MMGEILLVLQCRIIVVPVNENISQFMIYISLSIFHGEPNDNVKPYCGEAYHSSLHQTPGRQ